MRAVQFSKQVKHSRKITPHRIVIPIPKQKLALHLPQKIVTQRTNHKPQTNTLVGSGKGRILLIIGNGPSITEVEWGGIIGHELIDIMSVNKPDSRLWPTKYWTFFDSSQYRRHEELWNNYQGIIFTGSAIKKQKPSTVQFRNIGGKGWSRDLTNGLHLGRSTTYASMQIGAWLGYDHVYIFGCDMNPEGLNGQLHFYGVNPDVDESSRKERFQKEADHYATAAEILTAEEKQRFTFCSAYNPWPFVERFNRLDHREAVAKIIQ